MLTTESREETHKQMFGVPFVYELCNNLSQPPARIKIAQISKIILKMSFTDINMFPNWKL